MRVQEILDLLVLSRSCLYDQIGDTVFPPLVKFGIGQPRSGIDVREVGPVHGMCMAEPVNDIETPGVTI